MMGPLAMVYCMREGFRSDRVAAKMSVHLMPSATKSPVPMMLRSVARVVASVHQLCLYHLVILRNT